MQVNYFERKPSQGNFSMERVFAEVRKNLPADITAKRYVSRFTSHGFFKRLYNIFEAAIRQGRINHITGDVHFLTYLMRKNRTILTIHDCVFLHSKMSALSRIIIKFFWYQIPVRRAGYITTISKFSKDQIISITKCKSEKIAVIPDPLLGDFKYFAKNFNQKSPVILQIGTADNKNLFRLAAALEGIKCSLVIIGVLKKEQKLALRKHKIKYMNFYNLTDQEINKQYRNCDLVSFVSTYEGFGMPILEANATGRAVLTSNISPMKEVAGEGACLVDPLDIKQIRQGIKKIISNATYRKHLVKKGLQNSKKYDAKKIAKRYAALYRKVVAGETI